MDLELTVTARTDAGRSEMRLAVSGCLTEGNWPELFAVIRKACTLEPSGRVIVSLSGARHIGPSALNLLRDAVDRMERDEDIEPLEFRCPDQLPARGHAPEERIPPSVDSRT